MAAASPLNRPCEVVDLPGSPLTSIAEGYCLRFSQTTNAIRGPQALESRNKMAEDQKVTSSPDPVPTSTSLQHQVPMTDTATELHQAVSASKKRKRLTDAERRQKEEEKARKVVEKQEKEEAKKRKQVEAEEARKMKAEMDEERKKVKEAEKAKKDEVKMQKEVEKKTKEEEKSKKARSQPRINAFFRPTSASADSSRRGSVCSYDGAAPLASSRLGSETPQPILSDYEKAFPPFFVHPHTTLAPTLPHPLSGERLEAQLKEIKEGNAAEAKTAEDPAAWKKDALNRISGRGKQRQRYLESPSVKELMLQIGHGSVSNPLDLTSTGTVSTDPQDALRRLPVKYLKFYEDVRPPWIGTYTKRPIGRDFIKLCRNPFARALPKVNYDYESEPEWDEPEDAEDLGDLGSEDEEDGDGHDSDKEFLDDEGVEGMTPRKKQILGGDLVPVYTSMHWETLSPDDKPRVVAYGQSSLDLAPFQMGTLLAGQGFPIDPYSTRYWYPFIDTKPTSSNVFNALNMGPPTRSPLQTLQGPNSLSSQVGSTKAAKLSAAKALPPELMEEFKNAVDGSILTKIGLIEMLKAKFPNVTRNTVESTLLQVALRVGTKPKEKMWRLIDS